MQQSSSRKGRLRRRHCRYFLYRLWFIFCICFIETWYIDRSFTDMTSSLTCTSTNDSLYYI